MLQESAKGNQTSLIPPSPGDATARQRAYEEEQANIARVRALRQAAEAEGFGATTRYETRTASRVGVESAAAAKVGRISLGSTAVEEIAALHQWAIKFSQQAGLVQDNGVLMVIGPGGTPQPVRTPDRLLAVIALAHARNFQCPFVRYHVDRKGVRHATDSEPRAAALRAYLASPSWPGVRTWIWPGHDGGETAQQKAMELLRRAVEGKKVWDVSADKLAELVGVSRGQVEQLIQLAGYGVSRPVTASGRPKLDPRTRRVLLRLQIEA
jgi:hypothetical protein